MIILKNEKTSSPDDSFIDADIV